MRIEAITVCIDFSEWLEKCISNKDKLDRWIIVTHLSDGKTIKFCKQHNLECVLSNRVFEGNAYFAKGKAINDALEVADKTNWLMSLDADILLPNDFRSTLNEEITSQDTLYGSYRYDATGDKMQQDEFNGSTIPYGFFQLWHSSVKTKYVEVSKKGIIDDYNFSRSFEGNTKMLSLNCKDTYGGAGYDHKSYLGLRNLGLVK